MTIYDEVRAERKHQDEKWGGYEHDKTHNHRDFCSFIVRKLGAAQQSAESLDWRSYRRAMIEVAALTIAHQEVMDNIFPEFKGTKA